MPRVRPPAGSLCYSGSELLIKWGMWQANKWGIIALLAGLFAVGAAYFKLHAAGNADLANKVGATGVCAVLFIVAFATFLTARQDAVAGSEQEPDDDADCADEGRDEN